MDKPDTKVIRRLLNEGREKDLLDLMSGDSRYTRNDLLNNLPGNNGDREKDMDELYTISLATKHVSFIVQYGHGQSKVMVENRVYSAWPEAFEKWLQMGCLGIAKQEVDAYLKDNPLDEL